MLKLVARTVLAQVRSSDTVARLGGDEFAVLLPGCEHERACAIAHKILKAITGAALQWGDRTLQVGASIGVAALTTSHADAALWLAEADAACYAAKRQGRGTVCSSPDPVRLGVVLPLVA
jgi:diguanylate cyclase (GGDEF)-like protein